jgi:2-oxoglutarate ferredoxin oxidoreductase subunit alpha
LPTKTEQTDLLQAMFGRNGESPIPILAPSTPADCFTIAIEAFRVAVRAMTPVLILSEGFLANSAEPWKIPDPDTIAPIIVSHPSASNTNNGFQPYQRDPETFGRPWAIPGTPGLEHRVGGLAKQPVSGNVSYDPDENEQMVRERVEKVARLADYLPEQPIFGPASGDVLVISWGGTYGAVRSAVDRLQRQGKHVSHAHLRYLNPFPRNLGDMLGRFKRIIVPELNLGQLIILLRGRYGTQEFIPVNKVQGQPFKIRELVEAIQKHL